MGIGAVLDDLELPPPQGRKEAAAAAQLAALGAALRQAAPILHEAPEQLEPVALVSRALALTLGPTVTSQAPEQLEAQLMARLPHHLGLSGVRAGGKYPEGSACSAQRVGSPWPPQLGSGCPHLWNQTLGSGCPQH